MLCTGSLKNQQQQSAKVGNFLWFIFVIFEAVLWAINWNSESFCKVSSLKSLIYAWMQERNRPDGRLAT